MTLLAPSFFTVIFVVFGPAWLSPSEIWLGSTTVVASIVPTMSSMPGALAVRVVEEAQCRIAGPVLRVGRTLKPTHHSVGR